MEVKKEYYAGIAMVLAALFVFSGCINRTAGNTDREGNLRAYAQEELPEGVFVKKGELFYPVMPVERELDEQADPMDNKRVNEKRMFWFPEEQERLLPALTVQEGDGLVLKDESFDRQPLMLERIEERGYTLGVLFREISEGVWGFDTGAVCPGTQAWAILENTQNTRSLCVQAVGEREMEASLLYPNGALKGMQKGEVQTLHIYEGTLYRSREVQADTRLFYSGGAMELSDFAYTRDGYVELKLPDGLEAGTYEIAGYGLFCLEK